MGEGWCCCTCECLYSALDDRRRVVPWNSVDARRAARQARRRDLREAGGAAPKLLNQGGDGTATVAMLAVLPESVDSPFFQRKARTRTAGSAIEGDSATQLLLLYAV